MRTIAAKIIKPPMFNVLRKKQIPAEEYKPRAVLHIVADEFPRYEKMQPPAWVREYKKPPESCNIKQYAELLKAPHVLIAGATGCGKSTAINGILYQALNHSTPATVQLYLIDPKRVELYDYKDLPFCAGYTHDAGEALLLLRECSAIIEQRYAAMQAQGVKMYVGSDIYIVIDELADLLISEYKAAILRELQHLLQIGRAARVHVLAATQAPSRRILPAELTLNFTDRIALRCVSAIESKQIINKAGAEKITEYGRGLYLNSKGHGEIKIPQIAQEELNSVIDYWRD